MVGRTRMDWPQGGGRLVLSRTLMVIGIAFTLVTVLLTLRTAKRESRVRPGFDIARLVIGAGALLVMGTIVGVQTPVALAALGIAAGAVVGFAQGRRLEISLRDGRVFARRTLIGIAVWVAGIIAMQGAGLLNRTGVFRIGQTVAVFGVFTTLGLLIGRSGPVDEAHRKGAVSVTAALALFALIGAVGSIPALAQEDQPFPWVFEGTGIEHFEISTDFGAQSQVILDREVNLEIILNADGSIEYTSILAEGQSTTSPINCTNGEITKVPVEGPIVPHQYSGSHGDGVFTVVTPGTLTFGGTYTASEIEGGFEVSNSSECGAGREYFLEVMLFRIPRVLPAPLAATTTAISNSDDEPLVPQATDEGAATPAPNDAGAAEDDADQVAVPVVPPAGDDDPLGWLTEGDISTDEALASALAGVVAAMAMGLLTLAEGQQTIADLIEEARRNGVFSRSTTATGTREVMVSGPSARVGDQVDVEPRDRHDLYGETAGGSPVTDSEKFGPRGRVVGEGVRIEAADDPSDGLSSVDVGPIPGPVGGFEPLEHGAEATFDPITSGQPGLDPTAVGEVPDLVELEGRAPPPAPRVVSPGLDPTAVGEVPDDVELSSRPPPSEGVDGPDTGERPDRPPGDDTHPTEPHELDDLFGELGALPQRNEEGLFEPLPPVPDEAIPPAERVPEPEWVEPPGGLQLPEPEIDDVIARARKHGVPAGDLQGYLDGLNEARGGSGSVPIAGLTSVELPDGRTISAFADEVAAYDEARDTLRGTALLEGFIKEEYEEVVTERARWVSLELAPELRWAATMKQVYEETADFDARIADREQTLDHIGRSRYKSNAEPGDPIYSPFYRAGDREEWEALERDIPELQREISDLKSARLRRIEELMGVEIGQPRNTDELPQADPVVNAVSDPVTQAMRSVLQGESREFRPPTDPDTASMAHRPSIKLDQLGARMDHLIAERKRIIVERAAAQRVVDEFERRMAH